MLVFLRFLMDLRSLCKTGRPKRNIFALLIHMLFLKETGSQAHFYAYGATSRYHHTFC